MNDIMLERRNLLLVSQTDIPEGFKEIEQGDTTVYRDLYVPLSYGYYSGGWDDNDNWVVNWGHYYTQAKKFQICDSAGTAISNDISIKWPYSSNVDAYKIIIGPYGEYGRGSTGTHAIFCPQKKSNSMSYGVSMSMQNGNYNYSFENIYPPSTFGYLYILFPFYYLSNGYGLKLDTWLELNGSKFLYPNGDMSSTPTILDSDITALPVYGKPYSTESYI